MGKGSKRPSRGTNPIVSKPPAKHGRGRSRSLYSLSSASQRSSTSMITLSSPSPTPPPSPPPKSSNDLAGLDSSSELSELTEDEQDSVETNSKASARKQPTRGTRRSLIPDQMWGWYKKKLPVEEKFDDPEPSDSPTHADHVAPALCLYPLDDSFFPKRIALLPQKRVAIGCQTNAKTVPAKHNGYFASNALSGQHAEVWEQGRKVIANLLSLSLEHTRITLLSRFTSRTSEAPMVHSPTARGLVAKV